MNWDVPPASNLQQSGLLLFVVGDPNLNLHLQLRGGAPHEHELSPLSHFANFTFDWVMGFFVTSKMRFQMVICIAQTSCFTHCVMLNKNGHKNVDLDLIRDELCSTKMGHSFGDLGQRCKVPAEQILPSCMGIIS